MSAPATASTPEDVSAAVATAVAANLAGQHGRSARIEISGGNLAAPISILVDSAHAEPILVTAAQLADMLGEGTTERMVRDATDAGRLPYVRGLFRDRRYCPRAVRAAVARSYGKTGGGLHKDEMVPAFFGWLKQ